MLPTTSLATSTGLNRLAAASLAPDQRAYPGASLVATMAALLSFR